MKNQNKTTRKTRNFVAKNVVRKGGVHLDRKHRAGKYATRKRKHKNAYAH